MLNIRPILLVIGVLLFLLSIAMLFPALADIYTDNDDWKVFVSSSFFTAFVGISLYLTNKGQKGQNLNLKQAFILTTATWVSLVLFSSVPLYLHSPDFGFTNAFFEAMSGLTTTGATVMVGLDDMPAGILLWRSILQWLGGIGIIVMAMAILPMLKIGGMQLFRTESSDKSDKVLPRITQLCGAITGVYLTFTIICGFSLYAAGMGAFDALCHAMTTIATAGFSTRDDSIGYFDSLHIEMVMVFFMIASGIPYVLYIQLMRGNSVKLLKDAQVRWYLAIIGFSVLIITAWLIFGMGWAPEDALRSASFNIVSVTTTTGFASNDYYLWGSFPIVFIFLLAVVGGCTGSTTGGIKIFRYQVLFETAKTQINRLIQPHGIFKPLYNGKPISDAASASVLSFFILFAFCFTMLAILLSLTGLDYMTSMSAAASMMANLGPGLGDIIGPSGNYSSLSDIAKWLLTLGMLIGRLEIFTVLILFSPYFWKS